MSENRVMENVAVIGASHREERYSNKAMRLLVEYGHNPIPVAPGKTEILDRTVYRSLGDVPQPIDTVTVYVGAARQEPLIDDAVRTRPRRIIFNPGAENPDAYDRLKDAGIMVVEACTLVMLKTNSF